MGKQRWMKMRDRSRMKTGVMVHRMDVEKLDKYVAESEWFSSRMEENEVGKCASGEGIIRHGDDVYWLDTEGVIVTQPISEDNPIKVGVRSHTKQDGGGTSVTVFPKWEITLRGDDLVEYFSDEGVPLEDFVRRFGARLESNFWGIVGFLRDIGIMNDEEE
jgi:hypothetical protein